MKVNVSLSAAQNPYLMPDGMANMAKITTLGKKTIDLLPKDVAIGPKVVSGMYYVPRKAKPVGHSAAKETMQDLKYMTQRAMKVMVRVRTSTNPNAKLLLAALLPTVEGVTPALSAQIKLAVAALTKHATKSESVKAKVTKQKSVIREQNLGVFNESIDILKKHLTAAGVRDTQMVESSSMFGKTLLVKLGPSNVVSISGSDIVKFRAASRAALKEE